jgi:pimeloyl-ACP methyl ester carboxylesterase
MNKPVHKRHVLYFTGFDPKGPAHYQRLYDEQAQLQSAVKDYQITVGPRVNHSNTSTTWDVQFKDGNGVSVETCYEFARWDDVVRNHWTKHHWQIALNTLRTSWAYVRQGVAWQFLKRSWPAFLALFMPATLLLTAILLLGIGLVSTIGLIAGGMSPTFTLLGYVIFSAAVITIVVLFENRFHMSWLMRSFHFTRESMQGRAPDLQERLDHLADHIAHIVESSDADEILLIGHSTGGGMAVSALARAWQKYHLKIDPSCWRKISLLTVGQWFPLLSLMKESGPMRQELATVAQQFSLQWVDVSAPADGCCTALVDPLDAVRQIDHLECPSPKLLSPRFQTLFTPQGYRELKRDRFRLHFQYLMAAPISGSYDYFWITAGPQRLTSVFEDIPSVDNFRGISMPLLRFFKSK